MMHLGLFIAGEGHHIAAWRDPRARSGASQDIQHFAELARIGERGCFDLLFTADTQAVFYGDDTEQWRRTTQASRLEPITLFSALSMVTEHIGLVCTATTTYLEPYHVARQFASLDKISGGRAGWNLVTSSAPAEAYNFGFDGHPSHEDRYDRAGEFAEVVLGLWDSWQAGAVIEDQDSGIYFDPDKLHRLNHKGKHFSVRGPLTVHPSPQGRPVIVQAGQSEAGRNLAARTAEVIFTVQQDKDEARAFYADIGTRAAAYGRGPGTIKIMPGLLPVVGKTRAQAQEKLETLQSLIHPELGLARLSAMLGTDLSGFDQDGPLPDLPQSAEQPGRQKVVSELARRENLTIRQLYQRVTGVRGHRVLCGTAEEIANSMEDWYRSGAADGFNIMSLTYPDELNQFVDEVIPILRTKGLYRSRYEGRTLRENLGLSTPG
ncbi:MAG: LLM class flavin-dependent oxidoreductase [Rhodospirillales bacterium]|nr:LLM class flavin-dependent oxidoreductase [Rhodospirillales bacterium]